MMERARLRFLVVLLLSAVAGTGAARAHRDDYLNETLVYLTLERAELEGEYWFDAGSERRGPDGFLRHNAALEWGITDRWMVDGRVTYESPEGEGTAFDSARVETRYRFFEEGTKPVDVAVSFEVNAERELDGSTKTGVEPRLILSKDFAEALNITANLSDEIPLDSGPSAFFVALGARYNWTELFRLGSELQYDFGEGAGQVIPQMWFAFPHDVTLKLGYSFGFDHQPEDFGRIALEIEF